MNGRTAQAAGGLALLVALAALAFAFLAWRRATVALDGHNALVERLNAERSGPGAVLDALGVPGGRVIGEAVEALAGPKVGPDRRDVRAETADDTDAVHTEAEEPTTTGRRRRTGVE